MRNEIAGAVRGHCGLRNAGNDEKRTQSDQGNRIKSEQIRPNQTKSDQKKEPTRIKAQAVGSKLGRTKLELGRARWRRGGSERMNGKAKGLSDRKTTPGQGTRPTLHGQAKDLSDRNTCFICDTDERGSGMGGKYSLMFA